MKEWNCNDFVVDNSTKAAHPAHPPRNLSPKSLQNNVQGKIEQQREKTLFNLLGEDEVAKSGANSGKEFTQGILRYEISTDFDIDDWHCKETMENSAKIVYGVREDEHNKNSKGNLLTTTNPQIPQTTSNPNELNTIRFSSMPDEWRQILQDGLLNETRIKLRRKYPLGENSEILEAKSLAPDIKAALPEISVEKDQYHSEMQDQLGTGISAIVTALSSLRENTSTKKLDEVVESLMDAGKIFTNLHYLHTTSRKSLLIGEFTGMDQISSQGNPGVSKLVERNQKSHSQFHPHRGLRSQARNESISNSNHYGNNTKTKETRNTNSTNETTSQRVKRLLCGISDEEYRSKKQREDPDNGQSGFPGIVEILKQARALHGVHEELLLSWPCNASAVKHYQKPIKMWWDYCQRESINVFDVSLSPLKSFFLEIAQEPKPYETLNIYKTAILLLTPEKLEKDRLFTEFLKEISSDFRKT